MIASRTLICFPFGNAPGLRAEAAQLALGLAARGREVIAFGPLGPWRHALRMAKVTANEFTLPGDERKLTQAILEAEPQMIHAFGAEAAHLSLPLTQLVGAGGVATLGHEDLTKLNPAHFRTASTVFVVCEYLREQISRRLPAVPVVTTGYLLPPADPVPAPRSRFLAEALGIDDGASVVLLADMFNGSETDVALALIDATPLMAERVPDVQIVLAGSGLRLGELEQRAISVNNALGRRAVLLPGARDDIAAILPLATVAVGSGRFAMEAVGAGVATVAVGAAGMIGTYTAETAQVAHYTCCGRHGRLEPVAADTLATEVVGLFTYASYRRHFAADGQADALSRFERGELAEQVATYYGRSAPAGAMVRTPQRIIAVLPDDLRELLFTLPALSGLRAQYPLVQLQIIAAAPHQALLQQMDLIESVLLKPKRLSDWRALLRTICRPRADYCIAFGGDLISLLIAGASCAAHRLGFADAASSIVLTDHLRAPASPSPARALVLTNALGVSVGAPVVPPSILPETREIVDLSLLAAGIDYADPLLLLCPHADERRAWPVEFWNTLMTLLVRERPERIAVLGDAGFSLPDGVVPVAPVQDSLVLATLLARAQIVIAADTDTLHLADLLGVPTIGLYGPTAADAHGLPNAQRHPLCHREFPCHPCVDTPCPERHCLRAITPAEVARAIEALRPAIVQSENLPTGC